MANTLCFGAIYGRQREIELVRKCGRARAPYSENKKSADVEDPSIVFIKCERAKELSKLNVPFSFLYQFCLL